MAKKMIRPIRTETEYDQALEEIERYFENHPKPGTPEADRFDLLALIVEDYERKRWPIEPPEAIDAIRYRMETGGYTQADLGRLLGAAGPAGGDRGDRFRHGTRRLYPSRSWPPARLAAARIRHPDQEASPHDEN